MEMTGSTLCGWVLCWERPRLTHGTWRSKIVLQEEREGVAVTVRVLTHRAEDHVWLTRVGQLVVAHDVVWRDPWTAHASRAVVTEEEVTLSCALFENLATSARKVTGLKREAATLLLVFLDGPGCDQVVVVKCVDHTRFDAFQVGDTVALFNLTARGSESDTLYFTERSGIRHIMLPRQAKRRRSFSPPPPRPIRQRIKWRCLMCGWLNHPSLLAILFCAKSNSAKTERLNLILGMGTL